MPTAADLPEYADENGHAYLAEDTLHLWVWSDADWVDLGSVEGPAGSDAEVTDGNVADAIDPATALAPVIDRRTPEDGERRVVPQGRVDLPARQRGDIGKATS